MVYNHDTCDSSEFTGAGNSLLPPGAISACRALARFVFYWFF